MRQRRKSHKGSVQGHALLYGRSSKAIRIVNGEKVGTVVTQHRPPKKIKETEIVVQKKYEMGEDAKRRLDKLKDPLEMLSKYSRAQKYEAAESTEKYEYGLSDW